MPDAKQAIEAVADDAASQAAARTAAAASATIQQAKIESDTATTVAEGAVAAAATAAALAEANAAQAKIVTTEREASFYEGVGKWQTETTSRFESQQTELSNLKAGMETLASGVSSILQRLTPAQSGTTETVETTVVKTTDKENPDPNGEVESPAPKTARKGRRFF